MTSGKEIRKLDVACALEALPSHATAICGLIRGLLCSFRLHTVDLRIGRLDDYAREFYGVRRHGAGACAIGPDVVAHGRRDSSCLDRFGRLFIAGGEVGGGGYLAVGRPRGG